MPPFLYIGMVAFVTLFLAYTMRFQRATLRFGKRLAPDNEFLPQGMQDAITPPIQTVRNLLWPVAMLAVLVFGVISFPTYIGIVGLIAVWIGSGVIVPFLPPPDSIYFRRRILASLRRRQRRYAGQGDRIRLEAIAEVIERFEQLHEDAIP